MKKEVERIYWFLACLMLVLLTAWGIEMQNQNQKKDSEEKSNLMEIDETVIGEGAMSYEEYMAESVDYPVVIDGVVKEKQSFAEGKVSFSVADEDGYYQIYEMTCSEAGYEELTVGTEVCVLGYKGEVDGQAVILDGDLEIIGK